MTDDFSDIADTENKNVLFSYTINGESFRIVKHDDSNLAVHRLRKIETETKIGNVFHKTGKTESRWINMGYFGIASMDQALVGLFRLAAPYAEPVEANRLKDNINSYIQEHERFVNEIREVFGKGKEKRLLIDSLVFSRAKPGSKVGEAGKTHKRGVRKVPVRSKARTPNVRTISRTRR